MTGTLLSRDSPPFQFEKCVEDKDDGVLDRVVAQIRAFGRPCPDTRTKPCALRNSRTKPPFRRPRTSAPSVRPSPDSTAISQHSAITVTLTPLTSVSRPLAAVATPCLRPPVAGFPHSARLRHASGQLISLMDHLRVVRSPAAISTLERTRFRFERLASLAKRPRGVTLGLTPDIDLVWQTLRACPWRYKEYCGTSLHHSKNSASADEGLIHHDGGIGQAVIDDARATAAELYKLGYPGEIYEMCLRRSRRRRSRMRSKGRQKIRRGGPGRRSWIVAS